VSAVSVLDAVSLAGFLVAFVAAFTLPARRGDGIEPSAKFFLAAAVGIYAVVALSNVLEHASITVALDVLEDYLEISFFPLIAYVAYSFDVTERMRRMQRTQAELLHERDLMTSVIDTSPAAIVMVAPDGSVRFASERVRSLFGLGHGDTPTAGELSLRGYGHAGVAPRQTIADVAARAPFRDELFAIATPAEERVVSASAETTSGVDSSETVVALVDVTERTRTDAELAAYRRDLEGQVEQRTAELTRVNTQLEVANRAKQDFLSKMSHELRTPLNSIIGFTGVMLRGMAGELTGEQHTQLEMVERAGRRLLALVNDMLDISRIEAGQATVSMRPTQLHALMASLVAEMRPIGEERDITLDYDSDSTTPEVRTDPDKVEQIARNLISNAVKFSPEGSRVEVRLHDYEGGVEVIVRDSGRGMTEVAKAQAFDPFYQAGAAMAASGAGAGLGLAIAQELADLIGAAILVDSELGRGSVFTLRVPA